LLLSSEMGESADDDDTLKQGERRQRERRQRENDRERDRERETEREKERETRREIYLISLVAVEQRDGRVSRRRYILKGQLVLFRGFPLIHISVRFDVWEREERGKRAKERRERREERERREKREEKIERREKVMAIAKPTSGSSSG
jgi:hypothetical protein